MGLWDELHQWGDKLLSLDQVAVLAQLLVCAPCGCGRMGWGLGELSRPRERGGVEEEGSDTLQQSGSQALPQAAECTLRTLFVEPSVIRRNPFHLVGRQRFSKLCLRGLGRRRPHPLPAHQLQPGDRETAPPWASWKLGQPLLLPWKPLLGLELSGPRPLPVPLPLGSFPQN